MAILTPRRESPHAISPMDYTHDIFISYRRHNETRDWISEHFVPLLELRVEQELVRKPKIFVDTQLESGGSWPVDLANALGGSRILIALWSGNYLASAWCAHEFAHMISPNVPALSDEIDDGPMVFSTLKMIKTEFGQFATTKPAAEQNGNDGAVSLPLEGLNSGKLP